MPELYLLPARPVFKMQTHSVDVNFCFAIQKKLIKIRLLTLCMNCVEQRPISEWLILLLLSVQAGGNCITYQQHECKYSLSSPFKNTRSVKNSAAGTCLRNCISCPNLFCRCCRLCCKSTLRKKCVARLGDQTHYTWVARRSRNVRCSRQRLAGSN